MQQIHTVLSPIDQAPTGELTEAGAWESECSREDESAMDHLGLGCPEWRQETWQKRGLSSRVAPDDRVAVRYLPPSSVALALAPPPTTLLRTLQLSVVAHASAGSGKH